MHKSFKLSINYCGQYRSKYYDKNNIDKPCNENNHNIYSGNNLKIAKFFQPTSCDDSSKTFIELCKPTPGHLFIKMKSLMNRMRNINLQFFFFFYSDETSCKDL